MCAPHDTPLIDHDEPVLLVLRPLRAGTTPRGRVRRGLTPQRRGAGGPATGRRRGSERHGLPACMHPPSPAAGLGTTNRARSRRGAPGMASARPHTDGDALATGARPRGAPATDAAVPPTRLMSGLAARCGTMTDVRCPYCSANDDRVIDSRPLPDATGVRRRRGCAACGQRFTTVERVEHAPISVRKRNGAVEPFDADKLMGGLAKATAARDDVTDDQRRRAAAAIEARIRGIGAREVSSRQIGLEVLDELRGWDTVAYMRYASVYKGFKTPGDFRRELARLDKDSPPKARRSRR